MKITTNSFLRRREYEELAKLSINGAILDVGGSKKSGYHSLLKGTHTITTGNINENHGVDLVFDAQERWPFDNESFDCVLFINLLEHLYRYDSAIAEAFRVLKQDGRLIGVVPFLINVHGNPNDYFRYTKSTLEREFTKAGFKNVTVKPLGTGVFSVVYQCLIGFVPNRNWISTPILGFFQGLDRLVWYLKPNNKMSAEYMPLGYYFEARKS